MITQLAPLELTARVTERSRMSLFERRSANSVAISCWAMASFCAGWAYFHRARMRCPMLSTLLLCPCSLVARVATI